MAPDPEEIEKQFLELARKASEGRLPPSTAAERRLLLERWNAAHQHELPNPADQHQAAEPAVDEQRYVGLEEMQAAFAGDFEPARALFLRIELYDQDMRHFHAQVEFDTSFLDDSPELAAEYRERAEFMEELRRPRGAGLTVEQLLHNLVPPAEDSIGDVYVTSDMEEGGFGAAGQTFGTTGERALQNAAAGDYDLLELVSGFARQINEELRDITIRPIPHELSIHRNATVRQRYYTLLRLRGPFLRRNFNGETLLDRFEEAYDRLDAAIAEAQEEDDHSELVITDQDVQEFAERAGRRRFSVCNDWEDVIDRDRRMAEQLRSNACAICRGKLKDPCFLPCGHVFCVACAIRWTFAHRECATCQATGEIEEVARWITMLDVEPCEHEPPCIEEGPEELEEEEQIAD